MVTLFVIIICLLILVKSADVFVDQASAFAKKLKISDFLIGFTVVAFGTSLPELISTIFSALASHNELIVSNIIGSNVANSCLIIGLIAVFNNFKICKRDVNINIPLNIVAIMTFWVLAVLMGFTLNWVSGISLILIFFIFLTLSKKYNLKIIKNTLTQFNPLILILSLIFLVISGKICIDQIISFANQLNISASILGYFLLAIGTSLPELVITWIAVKKKDGELAIGNILGSNLFNLLFIFGISTFIRPVQLIGFRIDLVFLTVITIVIYAFAITGKKNSFSRKEGLGLLSLYILFILFQIFKI